MKKPAPARNRTAGLPKQLSFLPAAEVSPIHPPSATVAAHVLNLLIAGEVLTQPRVLKLGGGWRLAAHIFDLRELGWRIESDTVTRRRRGRAAQRVARYWIEQATAEVLP